MPDPKRRKKTLHRVLKWLLTLLSLAVAAFLVWGYLVPLMTANTVTTYQSYTAQAGDIQTTKSFSATLSVKKSETFTTTEECLVRDLYVDSGDAVKKGDPLILLSTGELFTASFDGVVNEIRVKKGDWVWPRFTVVQICDLENLEVSMNVDEYDVESLAVGQTCTVRVISLGVDFDTVIAHINRVSQSSNNVAFYSVTCDLKVPENVLPGMQATVTLPADSVTGVVKLDMGALSFDEDKKPYVLLKQDDGTYARQSVEVGLTDGMEIEIKSGLTAGQTVYAVSGSESSTAVFSLDTLYQAIFGKKVVVNEEKSARGPGGMGGGPGGAGGGASATDGTVMRPSDSTQAGAGDSATAGQTAGDGATSSQGNGTAAAGDSATVTGDNTATDDGASATGLTPAATDAQVATDGTAAAGSAPQGMGAPPNTESAADVTAAATPTATPTAN